MNSSTSEIQVKCSGCQIVSHLPPGIVKPGVVHILNRSIVFDEFVVSVSANSGESTVVDIQSEALRYLFEWTRFRLGFEVA